MYSLYMSIFIKDTTVGRYYMNLLEQITYASRFCQNPNTGAILRTACQHCGDFNHRSASVKAKVIKLAEELYNTDAGFRVAMSNQLSLFDEKENKVNKLTKSPKEKKPQVAPEGKQLSLFDKHPEHDEAARLVQEGVKFEKDVSTEEDPPPSALKGLDVNIFRNLTQNCFSINQPKIPGYSHFKGNYLADRIHLKNVSFYVNEASRVRGFLYGLKQKAGKPFEVVPYHKTVHASVNGTIVDLMYHEPHTKGQNTSPPAGSDWVQVTYNPIRQGDYTLVGSDIPVYSAEEAILLTDGGKQVMYAKNPSFIIADRAYKPLTPEQQEHFYNELLEFVDAKQARVIVYESAPKDHRVLQKRASIIARRYLNQI